jgi:hypothetical protein
MKTICPTLQESLYNALTLRQLVSKLVSSSLTMAAQKNTDLVNEIQQEIFLAAEMPGVFSVMKELLTIVVSNSKNGKIHISADRFRDVIILEIQERNNNNGYALAYQVNNIEPEAAAIGGHISMVEPRKKITTVSFSFPFPSNLKVA